MKNLAFAMRRDERAHQHNLLRWMICGSIPNDISDSCIGVVNSLMCVSFILRRLQPLVGEKHVSDQSYKVCFRPDKSELKDLYWEIQAARDFLWCIDMIYKSTLPAMNINSISLAPHAADRTAENQDRRKWVNWLKEIEREAVKGHVLDFDQNDYCTFNEKERELEKYPEDFADGEEPTWWVMGSSKTEPPQKTERQRKTSSSSGQRQQTSGGSNPQQGASGGWSSANDANKIDNEIIDSIFRMNSGGDDDRWEIIGAAVGHETYTSFEGGVTLGGATALTRLSRIIREQRRRHIDGATIRDMMIQKKRFLVLDWPLRAVNSKGGTKTFQMMVNEQGWTNIEERSYYGSSGPASSTPDTVNIISRLQKLEKLIGEQRRRDMDASPVSVHIWMPLYDWMCMRGCGWQVTTRPIIDSLSKTISDLVNVCKGMVVVCANRDVAFHGGRGDWVRLPTR